MDFSEQLKQRFSKNFTNHFVEIIGDNISLFEDMYKLMFVDDKTIAWRASWVCATLCKNHKEWFLPYRQEIVQRAILPEVHYGVCHQLLNILYSLPDEQPISIPLLNFCMDTMAIPTASIAIRALCIKIAHRLCQKEPELLPEFNIIISHISPFATEPAIKCTIRNIKKKKKRDNL